MAYIGSGTTGNIAKRMLRTLGAALLILPALSLAAGNDLLLGGDDLAAKVVKERDYQLLDARSAAAQQSVPLAFSTKYRQVMPIRKGLVFVVADSDAAALEIAQSIPAGSDRSVFAVKGGAGTWREVQKKTAGTPASNAFIVPKGTCELGAPALKFDARSNNQADGAAQKADQK
jgi:hypothetical protein